MKHIPPPPPLPTNLQSHKPPLEKPIANSLPSAANTPNSSQSNSETSKAIEEQNPKRIKVLEIVALLLFGLLIIGLLFNREPKHIEWKDATASILNDSTLMATPEYSVIQNHLKSCPGCELRFIEVTFNRFKSKHSPCHYLYGSNLKVSNGKRHVVLQRCPNSVDLGEMEFKSSCPTVKACYWLIVDKNFANDITARNVKIDYESRKTTYDPQLELFLKPEQVKDRREMERKKRLSEIEREIQLMLLNARTSPNN